MKRKLAVAFSIFILVITIFTADVKAINPVTNIGGNEVVALDGNNGQTEQTQNNAQTEQSTNSIADIKNDATVNLIDIKERELKTLQDYQDSYGDDTYGFVAYILNIIRLYSIPFGFVGIAISGIYRYIIGIRKLDVRDKGFGAMIGIITVMVICQVLPLIFAIVVKGWRG